MNRHIITYLISLLLFVSAAHFAQLTDGKYTGNSLGRKDKHHDGLITLNLFIADNKIDSINITKFNQSVDHKKYGKYVSNVLDSIPAAIINKQTLNVDAVSGATISSNAFILALANAIEQSLNMKLSDGLYTGKALGRKDKKHSGSVELSVKIVNSKIDSISINEYDQSIDHKKYGKSVVEAREKIPLSVIQNQSIIVDGISGATISSNAIKLAIARALEKARI